MYCSSAGTSINFFGRLVRALQIYSPAPYKVRKQAWQASIAPAASRATWNSMVKEAGLSHMQLASQISSCNEVCRTEACADAEGDDSLLSHSTYSESSPMNS